MQLAHKLKVNLLKLSDYNTRSGIGRYVVSLLRYLPAEVGACLTLPRLLPLADRLTPLRLLPVGVLNHVRGDILHVPQIMGCALQLWNPVRPSVATIHDMGFLNFPEEWQMLDIVTRQVLRLSLAGLKRFDWWITVSEFTRQSIIKHLGVDPNRVTAIYSGIDQSRFTPVEKPRSALAAGYPHISWGSTPLLLYVGSESPRKNFAALLNVVSQLRSQFPDLRLIKVGSAGGEQFRRSTLQIIQSLGLEDSVTLIDSISESDLPLFYAAADIFVTASKLEGFGFPVLEAMACGTPVVCSDAGSLPEVAGDAAVILKPDDIDGWCSAIGELIDQRGKSDEMVARGLAQAAKFTWLATAQQTASIYRSLN